eukprot:EG_transcript_25147
MGGPPTGPSLADLLARCAEGDTAASCHILDRQPKLLTAVDDDGWSPLIVAAREGQAAVMAELLRRGCPTDPLQPGRHSAIRGAAIGGHLDCVRLLLDAQANPNVLSAGDRTALHGAARGGHLAVVELLLARRADPAARNSFGETPLAVAATAAVRARLGAGGTPAADPADPPAPDKPADAGA